MSKIYRPLILFIGLRYVYGQKSDGFGLFVSWLSMIGIMLGSMGLIIVLSVMNGLEAQMQGNILAYLPQAQVTTKAGRVNTLEQNAQQLTTLKGVTHVTPLITSDAIVQSQDGITFTTLMGVNPSDYDPIQAKIFQGDFSDLKASQYNIIIGYALAKELNVSVGDSLRLMVTDATQITPIGRIPSQRLFTVSGIFLVNNDIDRSLVYINQADAQNLLRYPVNVITSWRLYLNDPLSITKFVQQQLPKNLIYQDWRSKRGELFQAIKMEKSIMGVLISLIVLVAAFNIITSLSLLVMEKQGEIAILKTQGLAPWQILLIFIIQGASAGFIGTLFGSLFGLLIAFYLPEIMSCLSLSLSGISLPTLIDPIQVIFITVGLLLLSLLSTLYPAYRAANIQPAEALRYE